MARLATEIAADIRPLLEEYLELLYEVKGHHPLHSGDVQVATGPQGTIVVWLPAHSEPHLAADLLRFIDAQREALGVSVPVLVTLASDVTVREDGA